MSRRPFIAANWKMNKTASEADKFLDVLLPTRSPGGPEVVICPSWLALSRVTERCAGTPVSVAAQNMHFEDEGAFTGEVSAPMLLDLAVDAVILGHSERRQLFGETDEALARKVPRAIEAGLTPILCVGETEEQRRTDATDKVLSGQVLTDLAEVHNDDLEKVVIAYEPIWAMVPAEARGKLEPAEVFHEILEHRWYLSENAGREVSIFDTARDYIDHVLTDRPDEAVAAERDRLESRTLDPARALLAATCRTDRLWRAVGPAGSLLVRVGRADLPSHVMISAADIPGPREAGPDDDRPLLRQAPVEIDLIAAGVTSLAGPGASRLAAALVGTLACATPPGQLRVQVVCASAREQHAWAWTR